MLDKSDNLQVREIFLSAMRTVANSVTVVTTNGPAGLHGATVSSFCSVSADPPTLLVCLNKEGGTGTAIRENGEFCINILPGDAAQVAKHFASHDTDKTGTLKGKDWQSGINGYSPVFRGATAFVCSLSQVVEATSHYVLLGRVVDATVGEKDPLIYLNQRFCTVENTHD